MGRRNTSFVQSLNEMEEGLARDWRGIGYFIGYFIVKLSGCVCICRFFGWPMANYPKDTDSKSTLKSFLGFIICLGENKEIHLTVIV